jgi:RHS repeat-associated protein
VSGLLATVEPRRIKASHRRRRKPASGQSVQRYYDPMIGRFLSVDPVTTDTVMGANFNRFKYAANNPQKRGQSKYLF